MKEPMQICSICGEPYQPFALESYEAQIEDADHVCKECLQVLVEEYYQQED